MSVALVDIKSKLDALINNAKKIQDTSIQKLPENKKVDTIAYALNIMIAIPLIIQWYTLITILN
jgi:hypothetical protein